MNGLTTSGRGRLARRSFGGVFLALCLPAGLLPLHGEPAYKRRSGESATHYAPIIEAPAAGDLLGDGETDIVAGDLEGNLYAWNAKGKLIFHETSDPNYTGAPLPDNPHISWDEGDYVYFPEGGGTPVGCEHVLMLQTTPIAWSPAPSSDSE